MAMVSTKARIGRNSGKVTCQKTCQRVAPSTRAQRDDDGGVWA